MAKPKKNLKISTSSDAHAAPERILVVGAAGYIGRIICDQFCSAPSIREIVAIDTRPMPDLLKRKKKLNWIESSVKDDAWKDIVEKSAPEIVIYAAWDFQSEKDNLEAMERFFEFCFLSSSVKKIIFLSSTLPYGALPENNRERLFAEGEIFRENEYPYAVLKKDAEAILARNYSSSNRTKSVFVLRLAMVGGPLAASTGEYSEPLMRMFSSLPYIFDPGEDYGIQYVHEDDLVDLIGVLTFNRVPFRGYEVFNVAAKDILSVDDLAASTDKWVFKIPNLLFPLVVSLLGIKLGGELSERGAWKYLSYPVFVDGSKIEKKLKFEFLYSAKEALEGKDGRYDYLSLKKEAAKKEIE
jgi:nucleoside-diphosphate-sugar epimerase